MLLAMQLILLDFDQQMPNSVLSPSLMGYEIMYVREP